MDRGRGGRLCTGEGERRERVYGEGEERERVYEGRWGANRG